MIKKFLQAEIKSVNKEEGTFEVVASTGKVDRLGDSIDPKGWYLQNYKKNPVILWSHSTGGFGSTAIPPVGKADKVWIEAEKELTLKGHFANTPLAQELKTLVEGGFLNAVSVGFLPLIETKKGNIEIEGKMYRRITSKELEIYFQKGLVVIEGRGYGKPSDEDIEKGIYDSEYGEKFTKQELLEVSWVSVPALPQALVSARKMNLDLVTKALEQQIKESPEEEKNEEKEEKEEKETEPEEKKESTPEPEKKEIPKERFDSLENKISEIEKVMSVIIKERTNPETNAFQSNDVKGRKPFVKRKSNKSDMERLLIMFDKMCETLLRKLRQ